MNTRVIYIILTPWLIKKKKFSHIEEKQFADTLNINSGDWSII